MDKQVVRRNAILDEVKLRSYVSLKEMAANFDVSEMTIRRDFKVIAANNAVKIINGTLVCDALAKNNNYELNSEEIKNNVEKVAIGRFAASLVEPNDIIIIDTGTTTVHVAANLPEDISVTVLCYNSNIFGHLQHLPNVQILLAGGEYHANTQMFESVQGIRFIQEIRAHKVFISAAGLHKDLGATCVESYEVATKKAVLKSAAQRILVADYTKFGVIQPSFFCNLHDIDIIVTNKALDDGWVQFIRDKGIKLYLV